MLKSPGMGNTAEVPIDQRIPIWLELVPKLLSHLSIDHVALLSHSSGTIYLLNTLYHCRDILHPERPYVAFLGILPLPIAYQTYLTKPYQRPGSIQRTPT